MNYTDKDVTDILYRNTDVLMVVSAEEDKYRTVKCSEEFSEFISKEGSYKELMEKLLFHMSDTNAKITDDYQVFLPMICEFKGKFSQKVTLEIGGRKLAVQMGVFPIEEKEGDYVIMLCNLDQDEAVRGAITENKVKTIQETYLFSMYVDLNKDQTSSINVSEISEDDMHYEVKYSEWRMMIVNMFLPEDQAMFLKKSDPGYLKANLKPGKTLSFDCQMKNLEGTYIWVKLIFGRTDTTSEQDFRFVFMVQNIHENLMQIFTELKKFEGLASSDALTGVFNRGRIETELNNALDEMQTSGRPVSLMMFDIDFFKRVNDTYGHAVGDEVLKEFVRNVADQLNKYDIRIGRWGGEEFVCVCYGLTMDELHRIAEEVRQAIADKIYDKIGSMTCSVGLASLEQNDTAQEAFERLDAALYEAKSSGRNCVRASVR